MTMAKESGLGANFYVDGYNLSGDTGSLGTISKAMNVLPMTGIDKYAFEREAALLTGRIVFAPYFNPDNAHIALETLPRTDRLASYWHKPLAGAPVASCIGKQLDYALTRDAAGALTGSVEVLSNAWWLDWGLGLTDGPRTDAAPTNGVGVDYASGANFGLQAYLHVFAFTGTSCTITIQQSSDNGVGDAFANVTGGSFTPVTTAPLSERIATARDQAVERYLRVVTTGTFSSISFAVSAVINRTDMTI